MVAPLAISGGTVMGVFLMLVVVLGYIVLWAIWHFVFRGAGDDDSRGDRRDAGEPPAG